MKVARLARFVGVCSMVAIWSSISTLSHAADQDPAATSASTPTAPETAPIIPPRTGKSETENLFDGKQLGGWDGNPDWWTVKGGCIVAKSDSKVPTTFLVSRKNYSDFRLTLKSKVVESDNHAGVAFWGQQVVNKSNNNFWAYNGLLVIFPGLGLWDYSINKGIKTDPVGKEIAKKVAGQHDWIQVEILAQGNRVRVAYNGAPVLDWREPDPDKRKEGPICLQLHGFSGPQEVLYKDVVIETFPKGDRLLTVQAP